VLDILTLKNKEAGRRAFVVANGPSILDHDLARLDGELVIGMNATTFLSRDRGFAMPYYVVSDQRFLNHPEKRPLATSQLDPATIRVLRADLEGDDPSLAERTAYVPAISRDGFSWNLQLGFFFGCTTSLLAVQLAAWLGASKIYVLGMDLNYPPDQPRFYKETLPELEDAFVSVQIHNTVNACRELATKGIDLVSCSPHSMLRPYIPYAKFESVLPSRHREPAHEPA
jgi:hypothetical protein